MLKLAVPDLISNSYFPAVAAVDLGCFAEQGLDVELELLFPVDRAYRQLRDGTIDIVAGSAHSALAAFPEWRGVKLLCAQAQGMYWFLVMRSDLGLQRGDLSGLRGRRIGAAPWVEMGLRGLLFEAGLDPEREGIVIMPVPGAKVEPGNTVNFGLMAADALASGDIDGFWANGMGAEVAVRSGAASVLLDVRRGDGPAAAFNFTMASIAVADSMIADRPEAARSIVQAISRAHRLLREDPERARAVADKRFPRPQAELIVDLIRRDLPFYDTAISRKFVAEMNGFARAIGILTTQVAYEDVVASAILNDIGN